jgi:hypothetical protein
VSIRNSSKLDLYKCLAEKNWQTFMDNTWDGKPLCVGAQRLKALRQGLPIFYAFPLNCNKNKFAGYYFLVAK